jgi:tRNA_anti-like
VSGSVTGTLPAPRATSDPTIRNLPLNGIIEASNGLTDLQKDQRLAPFRELSVQVVGIVSDISAINKDTVLIFLEGKYQTRMVALRFDDNLSKIQDINKGAKIEVECKFSGVGDNTISLRECRVIYFDRNGTM